MQVYCSVRSEVRPLLLLLLVRGPLQRFQLQFRRQRDKFRGPGSHQRNVSCSRGPPPAEPARDNQATPAAMPTADYSQNRRSHIFIKDYCQHLTYYFLYTLDILRDKKRAYDFNYVAYSNNELASIVFGNHAGNPCLTPDCPESKD